MNPTTPAISPGQSGGYVPYFYQSGLFQAYGMPEKPTPSDAQNRPSVAPASTETVPPVPHFDRMQTVEQIITNGYFAAPAGDPVSAILSDKHQTSWLGLDDVISQVRRRYEIFDQNVHELELGKCAAMNSLYTSEAYNGPADSKQFYSRHKRLQELYEQERDERSSLWKDVSRLRQILPESLQSYLGARRKIQALEEATGEMP